jgi:hypothetical protein
MTGPHGAGIIKLTVECDKFAIVVGRPRRPTCPLAVVPAHLP